MGVTPAHCERARSWISLRLDGMLSSLEQTMLDRHLSRCASCSEFAASAVAETRLLRDAMLEEPAFAISLPRSRGRSIRRAALGVATGAAAAVVATLTFASPLSHSPFSEGSAARAAGPSPMLVVVAVHPNPANMRVEVPRVIVQPASALDGPLHGPYNGVA